jgi:hypothetical protein
MKVYKFQVEYNGKGWVQARGEDEQDAIANFAKGDYKWIESKHTEVNRASEAEPFEQKYRVRWIEEKEAWFFATSKGTAEWKASCADDQELTSKKFKVITVDKID